MTLDNAIRESLEHYRFGATIEVTNTIDSCGRYKFKASQSFHSKTYLEMLTGGRVKVATGLAYRRLGIEPPLPVDVNISVHVKKYRSDALMEIVDRLYHESQFSRKQRRFIDKISSGTYGDIPLWHFLSCKEKDVKFCAGRMGLTIDKYHGLVGCIKGITMEFYVQHLLESSFRDKIIFPRFHFKYKNEVSFRSSRSKKKQKRNACNKTRSKSVESEADLIVLCKEDNFYDGIIRLNKRRFVSTEIITKEK